MRVLQHFWARGCVGQIRHAFLSGGVPGPPLLFGGFEGGGENHAGSALSPTVYSIKALPPATGRVPEGVPRARGLHVQAPTFAGSGRRQKIVWDCRCLSAWLEFAIPVRHLAYYNEDCCRPGAGWLRGQRQGARQKEMYPLHLLHTHILILVLIICFIFTLILFEFSQITVSPHFYFNFIEVYGLF